MKTYRQGDVMLIKVSGSAKRGLPEGATEGKLDGGRIVLAYGEVTGHAHAFAPEEVETGKVKLWDAGAERFIQVMEKTSLTHEEHSPVVLDEGVYKVVRQREYAPEAPRQVAD